MTATADRPSRPGPDAMSTNPTTRPARRWKSWAALAFVLAIACGVWLVCREGETVRKSRRLRLGQTSAELITIMGPPRGSGGPRDGSIIFCFYSTPSEKRNAATWKRIYERMSELGVRLPFLLRP